MTRNDLKIVSPFLFFYTALTFFVLHNPFFWDTIQLGSKQAHWFYEQNFRFFFLPEEIDSGHPPFFGMYLALLWKIFGRSLAVSHLALLPFLLGIVLQLYLLLKKYIKPEFIVIALLFLLADPTLLAQSILVSPDIVLIFFFLLALNALLSGRRFLLGFALIFLGIISLRGMMHAAIIFAIDFVYTIVLARKSTLKDLLRLSIPYIPSAVIAGVWLFLHYQETGWIGYHENSPWKNSFETVNLTGFFRNLFVLAWRLIDFGRLFIWLAAIPIVYYTLKNKKQDQNSLKLFLLFAIPFLLLTPNLLMHANLLGHRYLIALYLSFSLVVVYQIQCIWPQHFKKIVALLFLGLLSGNLWVYPDKISKGWDGTLAHYPYYELRKEMIVYIEKEKLDKKTIGTGFPNKGSGKYTDLLNENWNFADKNLETNAYIFYSNVFNEFSDEDLETLKTWKVLKKIESPTVKVILYKNPDL